MKHIIKSGRFVVNNRALFSTIQKAKDSAPAKRDYLQFSKKKLVDWG